MIVIFYILSAFGLIMLGKKLVVSAAQKKRDMLIYTNKYIKLSKVESYALREIARKTLYTKKELRESEEEILVANDRINEVTERILNLLSEDNTFYSFDDKVSTNFNPYVVKVKHDNYRAISNYVDDLTVQSWKKGRFYICWAEDAVRAEFKIKTRFNPNKGYTYGAFEELNDPIWINRD